MSKNARFRPYFPGNLKLINVCFLVIYIHFTVFWAIYSHRITFYSKSVKFNEKAGKKYKYPIFY